MQRVEALEQHYRRIWREKMRGLPFVNEKLGVESVAFRPLGPDLAGILISPWFINLVILPGDDSLAALHQGDAMERSSGAEHIGFTVDCAPAVGRFLSAVLFRSVEDFPDQATARPPASLWKKPRAIWDRPALCVHRNRTLGMPAATFRAGRWSSRGSWSGVSVMTSPQVW